MVEEAREARAAGAFRVEIYGEVVREATVAEATLVARYGEEDRKARAAGAAGFQEVAAILGQ